MFQVRSGFLRSNSSAPVFSASRIRRRASSWLLPESNSPSILTGMFHDLSNVKILITLSYGEGCIWPEDLWARKISSVRF